MTSASSIFVVRLAAPRRSDKRAAKLVMRRAYKRSLIGVTRTRASIIR
jgi:hypothetical protein